MAAVLGLSLHLPHSLRPSRRFYAGRRSNSSFSFGCSSLRRYGSISKTSVRAFSCKASPGESWKIFSKVSETTDAESTDNVKGDGKDTSEQTKTPFGYTRKDVLLIGLGITVVGVALKSGLEFVGVDSLQAGNVVQLVVVLGLTVGWISTYMFRVSNKEMTYAQQLRDYENKVMQKRLEGLTEAELEELLAQVEEERLSGTEQNK
ncbi:hypothetical protein EJ110_NYTH08257 [Nymphaea thermarum]|nr:hypothetical protein EJ110_NYTH08257 [Nymphaea thermarum]